MAIKSPQTMTTVEVTGCISHTLGHGYPNLKHVNRHMIQAIPGPLYILVFW